MKKQILFALLLSLVLAFMFTLNPVSGNASDWYPDDKLSNGESSYGTSSISFEPVGIADVTSEEILKSFTSEIKPATAILTLDNDINVTAKNGDVISTLAEALDNYLKKNVIPILKIADKAGAEKLINWFKTDREISDVAVLSSDAEAVGTFRAKYPYVRGIVEFDENADITEIYKIANKNGANACIIPEKLATVKNVRYIQGRFKTVWVRAENDTDSSIRNSVTSGAYGVITENIAAFNAVLASFENGLTRLPFNVAHRGLPHMYNENSVSGTLAAIKAGATHVELDCYLTTDNEIVFMHDAGLQRTSTGTGNIETYSSKVLKKFRLKQFEDEAIPFFEDIAGALKGTDVVLILEIKSQKTEIVDALKEKLAGSGIENQIVVISFHEAQLKKTAEVLPEIPAADLNGKSSDTIKAILKKSGEYNCGIDYNYNALDDDKIKALICRGFIPWTWTYSGDYAITLALEQGFTGLTNNNADSLAKMPVMIEGKDKTDKIPAVGEEIELTATEYGGEKKDVKGTIISVKALADGKYEVFAKYNPTNYFLSVMLYTQKYAVTVETPANESPAESGNGSTPAKSGCGSAAAGGTIIPLIIAAAVIAIKKGKKDD